ncbi:hypothetical protein SUGI_1008530 [Cryptomeria japonica]|nr:hypothetical protein SUGI_1008530 [Cryptomeria japonica]
METLSSVLTPEEEKGAIRDITETAEAHIREGDTYYLLNFRWWKDWVDYVGQDVTSTNKDLMLHCSKSYEHPSNISKRPPSIDNSDLVANVKCEDPNIEPELHNALMEGRDYVLLPQNVWRQILKWYGGGPTIARKVITSGSSQEDLTVEVYPLRLRLIVIPKGNQVTVQISKKDTIRELCRRACELFNLAPEQVSIWDYFGQTKHALMNDLNKTLQDSQIQMDQDILLEVQWDGSRLDGCQSSVHENGSTRKEITFVPVEPSRSGISIAGGPSISKGVSRSCSPELSQCQLLNSPLRELDNGHGIISSSARGGSAGLTGLQNLGNTCFMNSAIQCLVHTPELVRYFREDYSQEINWQNPLGMVGELALAFGELLRKLWAPGRTPVAPRPFKGKLARFAPQFSGYNQHDSQELLAFLLDGLHEDLNRVKHKPYIKSRDADGRPDEEVADEYWANHIARNDSIIVDVCQGQYKSTLVCPVCNKISVTFDPFMYLSLPLPSATSRTMTITVFSSDGSALPTPYTVTVPKQGKCKDLVHALNTACSLRNGERLLLAEIYNHRIFRYLEDSVDLLSSIRDDDHLAAYKVPKFSDKTLLLQLMHRRKEEYSYSTNYNGMWKAYGTPLVASLRDDIRTGADIHSIVQTLLAPMLRSKSFMSSDHLKSTKAFAGKLEGDTNMQKEVATTLIPKNEPLDATMGSSSNHADHIKDNGHCNVLKCSSSFRLCLVDEKSVTREIAIVEDEPVSISSTCKIIQVFVDWTEKELERYDTRYLEILPEVFKLGLASKKARLDSISLYACLEAFLSEEPLAPEHMWYCPCCKERRQASKKLDLWRLPKVLVVHLKRFSYSRSMKNKLETLVNFPIHDLDLTKYVARRHGLQRHLYQLYAVSNHYGSMGSGHYTAHVKLLDENRWYNFDDSHVSPISEDEIRTPAAYLLFYRRIKFEDGSMNNGAHSYANRDSFGFRK